MHDPPQPVARHLDVVGFGDPNETAWLQLALYLCYELHYRGFDGVDGAWEWDPEPLRVRAEVEPGFLAALRTDVLIAEDVGSALDEAVLEPMDAESVSYFPRDEGGAPGCGDVIGRRLRREP
ncbi:hypothetical protein [Streptomyces sp. NPDC002205]|uniref:hypothetical protein n=1 Tax=Streptomyces sp. NPDC002205 TaxID=3154411 RepID=UPI0033290026